MSADRFGLRARSVADLLALYADVLTELRARDIIRSTNNPVADYSEWLVAKAFGYALAPKSSAGYDVIAPDGTRYQVKGRRSSTESPSRQLSFIRGFGGATEPFDYMVGILFNSDFTVMRAAQIPVADVHELAVHNPHVNGWRFILRDSVWDRPGVVDVTGTLQQAATASIDETYAVDTKAIKDCRG